MTRNPTKIAPAQAVMDLTTDEDRARAAEEERRERMRQHTLKLELFSAMKAATIAMGGNKVVAGRLDTIWADPEQPDKTVVGESLYKAALDGTNYNRPRIEWLIELALDPRVANVLRAIADGRADIEAAEELENLKDLVREMLPKHAAEIERAAKSRRRKAVRR